jgi:alpha-D-xyloside xylohydrolase
VPPGYGFIAAPSDEGWTHQQDDEGDVYRTLRLAVTVVANHPGKPVATEVDIAKFFSGSAPAAHITISTPQDKTLLDLTGWWMSVPLRQPGLTRSPQGHRMVTADAHPPTSVGKSLSVNQTCLVA